MLIVCPQCLTKNRVPDARLFEQPQCGQCRAGLLPGRPVALDDAGFDRHVQGTEVPVVVDFWAAWCGPCRMMAPQFEQAAQMLPGVSFIKVDTEAARQTAARCGIRSIPTLMVFQNGREVARQSGVMQAAQLVQWVQQVTASPS